MGVKDAVRLQPFLRASADNFDWAGWPHIQTFAVTGPFDATGPGDTPSRRQVFRCRPASRSTERACAERILSRLARRAYRQPVGATELKPILDFYDAARTQAGFDAGIQRGLQRILASPRFVFRSEGDRGQPAAGRGAPRVGPRAGVPPVLLPLEQHPGRRAVDRRGARRAAPAGRAGGAGAPYAGRARSRRRWSPTSPASGCTCATSAACCPTPTSSRTSTTTCGRPSGARPSCCSTASLREDRSALDLLRADYTFVNERLARHYGIPNVYGSRFRRVAVRTNRAAACWATAACWR